MTTDNLTDQLDLIAGDFSKDIAEFLGGGGVKPFVLASRARRALWVALIEIAPAQARSGLVRFGFDADPQTLLNWVLDEPPPLLWPVIRRCMPAAALPKGWYSQIATHLRMRPRTGRVWLQGKSMRRNEWATTLALPPDLIEPSVIALMNGNIDRAEAVRDLWDLAQDQGRDPSNLRRAICDAKDMDRLENLLKRAVQADALPAAPIPAVPSVRALRTRAELETAGRTMHNCMSRSSGFGLRRKSDAYFMWLGDPEGDVMVRCSQDHHLGFWRLAEIRLKNNRNPSEPLRRRIAEAFASVAVRDRPDVDSLLLAL